MIKFFKCQSCNIHAKSEGAHEFAITIPSCTSCNLPMIEWDVKQHFKHLVAAWEVETAFTSSSTGLASAKSFREIVELAKTTTPRYISCIILEHIHQKPSHLVRALSEITGENPLTEEMSGDIIAQCKAWVQWGKRQGMLWIPAKQGDVIEVIPSHYVSQFEVGERFMNHTLTPVTLVVGYRAFFFVL